jgi:hypothetical protein
MIYYLPGTRSVIPLGCGLIRTPGQGGVPQQLLDGWSWIADNEVYTNRFDWDRFMFWLHKMLLFKETCKFVTVPDVIGNALATKERYNLYATSIRDLGYRLGFVAQDGQESLTFPDFDALFIGGTTDWKLGSGAMRCIRYAQNMNKWVHVGRINSRKRFLYFRSLGVDSCDGTCLIYGPSIFLPKIANWVQTHPLWEDR